MVFVSVSTTLRRFHVPSLADRVAKLSRLRPSTASLKASSKLPSPVFSSAMAALGFGKGVNSGVVQFLPELLVRLDQILPGGSPE